MRRAFDENRAWEFARQIRSGTVGHNAHRNSHAIAFGGFKQSGVGREGGREGLLPYLETKAVILDREPSKYMTSPPATVRPVATPDVSTGNE